MRRTQMTFDQFRATGREVDNIGEINGEDWLFGVNGRVYMNDTLWCVPCVTSGVGWSTVVGNREFQSSVLRTVELRLYAFAKSEGAV